MAVHHKKNAVYAGILDLFSHLAGDDGSCFNHNLARVGMGDGFGGFAVADALGDGKLLIELVAADMRKVVPLGIKEGGVDQVGRGLDRRRLAGTELVVDLDQSLLAAGLKAVAFVLGSVSCDGRAHALVVAE